MSCWVLSTSTGFHYSVRDRTRACATTKTFKRGIEIFDLGSANRNYGSTWPKT